MTVNQDRLALGTAALRSGEYQQGKNRLRVGDKYCCLGVLTEVAIANGVPCAVREGVDGATYYDGSGSILSFNVAGWYGFAEEETMGGNPALEHNGVHTDCVTANDDLEWDFNQIADALDATYGTKEDSGE